MACGFALIILGVLFLYAVQQRGVRISQVDIFGGDAALSAIAKEALQGSYVGIVPRDSIFFYPEEDIRTRIMHADSDIATISVFRKGLTGLTIKVTNRAPIARWCGSVYEPRVGTSTPAVPCYVFDDAGRIYATTTALELVNRFALYTKLEPGVDPAGTLLPQAEQLPAAFNFARQLGTLGSPVDAVVIRDQEVDDHLESGTRVTYVLGQEQEAYTALMSGKSNINLADGSLEYLDLRFSGKMYLKRKSDTLKK